MVDLRVSVMDLMTRVPPPPPPNNTYKLGRILINFLNRCIQLNVCPISFSTVDFVFTPTGLLLFLPPLPPPTPRYIENRVLFFVASEQRVNILVNSFSFEFADRMMVSWVNILGKNKTMVKIFLYTVFNTITICTTL